MSFNTREQEFLNCQTKCWLTNGFWQLPIIIQADAPNKLHHINQLMISQDRRNFLKHSTRKQNKRQTKTGERCRKRVRTNGFILSFWSGFHHMFFSTIVLTDKYWKQHLINLLETCMYFLGILLNVPAGWIFLAHVCFWCWTVAETRLIISSGEQLTEQWRL